MTFDELDGLRATGARAIVMVMWLCVAVLAIGCVVRADGWEPMSVGVVVAAIPTALVLRGRSDARTRLMLGLSLMCYPALLLYQWADSGWQIDIHMLFFALLAVLAVLCDWRPIVAATVLTAVHHLATDVFLPDWVFPAGSDLPRVVLHAVILVIEAGVLIQLVVQLERIIRTRAQIRAQSVLFEHEATTRAATADEQQLVIQNFGDGLKALATGDLTHRIATHFPEDYAGLKTDFNAAAHSLHATVDRVAHATAGIRSESSEISRASDDLARRTEHQAASLKETAATMTELTTTVRQTTAGAVRASQIVAETRSDAEDGGRVVGKAIAAMGGIERASSEISEIISVIDGIAFQTNLLALNAGVEAARAGDAGRGFAVVASEVRALAQRSADAAKDVKARIVASGTQVKNGVDLVGQTGRALDRIVARIAEINQLVAEIAGSAEQEAIGLQQVNVAIGEMDTVTQQNAAMVEQSTAAARSLVDEAEDLAAHVARFRLSAPHDRAGGRQAEAA